MKKMITLVSTALVASVLVGCGGGGGARPELNQVEKAARFIKDLNYYEKTETTYDYVYKYSCECYVYEYRTRVVGKYSNQYSVAKGVSLQDGYAVILDSWNNKYFSISMKNGYTGYNDAKNHLDQQTVGGFIYFNLTQDYLTGEYIDPRTGTRFEAKEVAATDISALKAEIAASQQNMIAANLSGLGMSAEKSKVAAAELMKAGDEGLTMSELNKIGQNILGISLTDATVAALGSESAQNAALQKAVDAGAAGSIDQARSIVTAVLAKLGAE